MAETNKQKLAAQAAKKKALKAYAKYGCVGAGLTRRKGRYVVKILLDAPLKSAKNAPDDIDGVPIVTQVVGQIRKQSRKHSAARTKRRAKLKSPG